MDVTRLIAAPVARTRALPAWAKYLAACGAVAALLPLSLALAAALPPGYPFLPFLFAVLIAGSLFDQGSAFVATALSAALAAWFFLPPVGSLRVEDPRDAVALLLFLAVGASIAAVVEVLHSALLKERRARGPRQLGEAPPAAAERVPPQDPQRPPVARGPAAAPRAPRPRPRRRTGCARPRSTPAPSPASTPGSRTATRPRPAPTGPATRRGWTPRTSWKACAGTWTGPCPAASCGRSP